MYRGIAVFASAMVGTFGYTQPIYVPPDQIMQAAGYNTASCTSSPLKWEALVGQYRTDGMFGNVSPSQGYAVAMGYSTHCHDPFYEANAKNAAYVCNRKVWGSYTHGVYFSVGEEGGSTEMDKVFYALQLVAEPNPNPPPPAGEEGCYIAPEVPTGASYDLVFLAACTSARTPARGNRWVEATHSYSGPEVTDSVDAFRTALGVYNSGTYLGFTEPAYNTSSANIMNDYFLKLSEGLTVQTAYEWVRGEHMDASKLRMFTSNPNQVLRLE